jgi:predicted dehydrogenase
MQPLDLAIVGCGAVVEELHVPAIRRLARLGAVKVAMLVDRSEVQTARLKSFFPGAAHFDDLAAAFSSGHADVALIASPPSFHRAHVETALQHRCHVLCEKPLATTAGDVAELSRLSSKAQLRLMVGLTRRFFP